jgi:hypothetical protein
MHSSDRSKGINRLLRAAALLSFLALSDLAALPVETFEEPPPAVLEQIPDEEGLNAVSLATDGALAASSVVTRLKPRKSRTRVRFHRLGTDEAGELVLAGEVRDLLFGPDGGSLYALLYIPGKRRLGDVDLLRIESVAAKVRRRIRLPPSAQGLAYWPAENALLVICAQEIRSLLLPDLRSGPLYRLLGVNTSGTLVGRTELLVGREDGLVLIDLHDPPGEDEMPVRLEIGSSRAVEQVSVSVDGTTLLARLEAGSIVPVDLADGSLGPSIGVGLLPSRPSTGGKGWGGPETTAVLPVVSPPGSTGSVTLPAPAAEQGSSGARAAQPTPGAEPPRQLEAPPTERAPTPLRQAAPEAAPASGEARERSAGPTATASGDEPASLVAGSIGGPGAARVGYVVFLGPDNILREAHRLRPEADGRWSVDGLLPGRYRIQLSGEGGSVLVTDPPFHVVDLRPGATAPTVEFQVLDAR